jgi:hypothetical protein
MTRCLRCRALIIGYADYCADCQHWLDAHAGVVYDERQVVGLEVVAGWVMFGEREQTERSWECW